MKVSIIVSSYNYEKFLAAAIDSALNQTHPDVEVIVVDDGSTDSSPAIMRRYEGRAKLLHKPNGRQASAFNFAFPHATGDLVLFLDSDDLLEPHAVERIAAAWEPGFSKIHFPLEIMGEDGVALGARVPRAHLPEGALLEDLLETGLHVSPPISGNAFSREYLAKIFPIPEKEWIYGPDTYLIFLAPFHGRIGAIHECLGRYRRHGNSLTNVTTSDAPELVRRLRPMLESNFRLRRLLETYADRQGLRLSPDAVTSHWLHLKVVLSLRKAGALDRNEGAGPVRLAGQLLRAVWRSPDLGLAGRIQFSIWTALMGALPGSAVTPLIRLGFAPGDRRAVLMSLVKGTA